MPKISVVIPLYNKEKSIASTLQTVLNQTFTDYEIVIVNDGSTDNSVAEVEKIHDARIRLINQQNAGVSAARNRGVEEAKGKLIAFLDADDEWKPEYLSTQYQLSQKYPECSVFACNYEIQNFCGNRVLAIIRKLPFKNIDGIFNNYFEVASCSNPPLWTSAVMVKKQALLSVGGFPVNIKSGEDLLTWARLAVNEQIAYTRQVLARFIMNRSDVHIPKRSPDMEDYVGQSLIGLYSQYKRVLYLRNYISYYYRGRAMHAMECSLTQMALKSAFLAIRYDKFRIKNYLLVVICLFPQLYFRFKRK